MTPVKVAFPRLGLVLVVSATIGAPLWPEQVTRHVLMAGTPYETPYYIRCGDDAYGPKICVIGGVHGNEVAGYVAARRIANWHVTRGTLIVLPEAHREAIRRNQRGYPGNMNAMFPGDPDGDAMHRLAYEIWHLIDDHRPNLLLTLHESVGFHRRAPNTYGYTLCHDFEVLNPLMERCLDRANADIPDPLRQFEVFVEPHPTCPTYCAWSRLRIPATSIETCMEDALRLRVRYQLMMCMAFFDEARLGYEQTDVPRLSTAARPTHTALEVWAPHLAAVARKEPPPQHYGLVQVNANVPEARVFIDGYYAGRTPASVALPAASAGRAVPVAVGLDGYRTWSTVASVGPEQYVRLLAELTPTVPPPPAVPGR